MPNLQLKFWYRFLINRMRPFRDLENKERVELQQYMKAHKNSGYFIDYSVAGYLFVGFIFGFFGIVGTFVELSKPGTVPHDMLVICYSWILCCIVVIRYSIMKYDFQKDLTSPVYNLQGICQVRTEKESYDFMIDRYRFHRDKTTSSAKDMVQNIKTGDIVFVQFSPSSHFIWNIDKLS